MANLYRDFDADNAGEPYPTFDRMVHVRTTPHGVFRAVVEVDEYPDAPYFDAGHPVVRVERGGYGGAVFEMVDGLGRDSAAADGLEDDLATILQRVYDGGHDGYGSDNAGCHDVDETLEVVGRWLEVFHGGSLTTFSSSTYQGGYDYVTYDTRAMRESWGQTGEMLETSAPDGNAWQAYIDGDVYLVSVEQATAFYDDGEPADWSVLEGPVGGYYGDDDAAASALEMLEDEVERKAAEMLPLD